MAIKLNKAQQAYIEANRDNDPKSLAKDAGVTVAQVKAFLKTLPPVVENKTEFKRPSAKDFIQFHSEGGKKGVAVMNEPASQWGDEGKKNKGNPLANPRYNSCLAPTKKND